MTAPYQLEIDLIKSYVPKQRTVTEFYKPGYEDPCMVIHWDFQVPFQGNLVRNKINIWLNKGPGYGIWTENLKDD